MDKPISICQLGEVAHAVVKHFAQYGKQRIGDDVSQEALLASWQSAKNFDPQVSPNLMGYLYTAGYRQALAFVVRDLCPVSIGSNRKAAKSITREEVRAIDDFAQAPGPEHISLAAEREQREAKWRDAFHAILRAVLHDYPERDVAIVYHRFGLGDYPQLPPREVAKVTGASVAHVYRVIERARARICGAQMYGLFQHLKEIKEETTP